MVPTSCLGAEQENKLLLGLIVELHHKLLPLVQACAAIEPQAGVLQPNNTSTSHRGLFALMPWQDLQASKSFVLGRQKGEGKRRVGLEGVWGACGGHSDARVCELHHHGQFEGIGRNNGRDTISTAMLLCKYPSLHHH